MCAFDLADTEFDLFVEQAEYIESEKFAEWTIQHPDEDLIIRKLCQPGAKLITGPRGCGKTTLLLKAYNHLCDHRAQLATLPVYVNFKASLRLEPFYRSSANAGFLFQQWLVYKVYAGLLDTLDRVGTSTSLEPPVSRDKVKRLLRELELGRSAPFDSESNVVTPSALEEHLERIAAGVDCRRCVLLLDDAAHAFSVEQQRDFFEFFRAVKSKCVSPKAAVYPGVTVYSPTFHVGHDAEEVDVWLKADSPSYIPFMRRVLERRLPEDVWARLAAAPSLLSLVCYSAFGIPRALLNMVRSFYKGSDDKDYSVEVRLLRGPALASIKQSYEGTMAVFNSLRLKLPMYQKFIESGRSIFDQCLAAIKRYNRGKANDCQSVTIAIRKPVPAELNKVLGFFQYAGLLLPRGEISRGEKGTFELYVVHYAALVDHNALIVQKSVNTGAYVEAFEKRHSKEFTRVTAKTLLGTDDAASVLSLSLPPCQNCRTPRSAESARFCLNCGAKLTVVSVFESLVENDISELKLTRARVDSIKRYSKLRTIKDILLDYEHRQLRGVKGIGPFWAKRIYSYAEEYIA